MRKVAGETCRFRSLEVKHCLNYCCRSEHFPEVGDSLLGLDQSHEDHARGVGFFSSLNSPDGGSRSLGLG